VLGVEALPFFYSGLVLLATGSGLLKPNVSTLVGNLYRDRPQLRDQGFNIYYMGVNIGAFICAAHRVVAADALRLEHRVHVGGGRDGPVAHSFVTFKRYVAEAGVKVDEKSAGARALPPGEIRSRVIHAARDLRHLAGVLDRVLPDLYTFTFWARDSTATTWNPETFRSSSRST
jgi:hypothetical protein